ncbi:cyclase family protein [Mammaliicoccus sciuri]|jgi:arylformamidase|nr:cyclase family protein [Mammaliicoccus sciuri]MBA1397746.1 arylformamidase [Mammaliicoccus sciuri]MBF0720129.1 cyclase family protein [Mammaliicoccus sciuri]MBF0774095.1 cyclase family protein [Mammaliicoccus sciuri]MBG9204179.1 cyclase family protein [Mammaliicoccus sciuri]MBG9211028.1 cyclase family protein [Mammaliicoccus sciuri]
MWIDITQQLTNNIAHWPGDEPFHFKLSATKEETGSVNIGSISTSTHIGTHMDAPYHFDEEGIKIHEIDVNRLIGDATLIEIMDETLITQEILKKYDIKGTIIMIKTKSEAHSEVFPESVPVLTEDAIQYLSSIGIKVFGIDVPSVDDIDSKTLNNHHAFNQYDIINIENLLLENVSEGYYNFIGLPLNIVGADGSPIRAVISKKGE